MTLTEPLTQPRWPCVSLGVEIECAPRVLHTICLESVLGLRKLSKGGLEVGGVLFGERSAGLTRVLAVRPIECEHRFGPSFILSEEDQAKLQETLTKFRTDEELACLEILGCYFSHSRHGAMLTDGDVKLCDRCLCGKDQIAVTLIPSPTGGVRGTLLARAQGTFVPCHEFEYSVLNSAPREAIRRRQIDRTPSALAKTLMVARMEGARSELLRADAVLNAAPHITASEPGVPVAKHSSSVPPNPENHHRNLKSILLVGVLILIACWPNRSIPATQLQLRFADRDNALLIRWDAAAVREASQGTLDIRDGDQEPKHLSIGADLLRRGVMAYERKSELVRISFSVVARGVTISESAIYFAPQQARAHAAPPEAIAAKLEANLETPVKPVNRQTLERIDTKPATLVSLSPDRKRLPRNFHVPSDLIARSTVGSNPKPALLPEPPALRVGGATDSVPPLHASTLSLPVPHLVKLPSASGRLIWTGRLPKRSMLSLSAQGASLGYLNGWFPRKDVKFEVRPAELIEGGMVIFTKEQKPAAEAPSAANGWNTVVYKQDMARASELEILDVPGPANEWSQLMLRNGIRSLSVIVVDWWVDKN